MNVAEVIDISAVALHASRGQPRVKSRSSFIISVVECKYCTFTQVLLLSTFTLYLLKFRGTYCCILHLSDSSTDFLPYRLKFYIQNVRLYHITQCIIKDETEYKEVTIVCTSTATILKCSLPISAQIYTVSTNFR